MPYEKFEHAVVGGKLEYDWPLNPQLRLPQEAVQEEKID
jgi:hypothetical protein